MKRLIVCLSLLTICYGDPETVDGLIEKKRIPSAAPSRNEPIGRRFMNISPTVSIPFFHHHGYLREEGAPPLPPFERIWKAHHLSSSTSTSTTATTSKPKSITRNSLLLTTITQAYLDSDFEDINQVSSPEPAKESIKRVKASPGNVNEVSPQYAALSQKKSNKGAFSFDEEDSKNGIAALIIGFAFVVVFVAIAVSLVAIQSSRFNFPIPASLRGTGGGKESKQSENQKGIDRYEDEDQTPPELRGLGSHPSFVQPDVKSKEISSNEQSPPFFYGKLMLNDSPTEGHEVGYTSKMLSNTVNSMTSMLLAAQEAISSTSPSPPAKETEYSRDLMVMDPKNNTIFGGSEGEDEHDYSQGSEEESDDTVYECRGLASPGEMEVNNPFYLHGQEAFSIEGGGGECGRSPGLSGSPPITTTSSSQGPPAPLTPKPISQCPLLHQGIKGYN